MWRIAKQKTGWLAAIPGLLIILLGLAPWPEAAAARANLPTANEVTPGKRMALDGEYRISTLNKRVLMERGRVIALEGWKHMFLWDVEPGMVVIRDIRHVGGGRFTGRDLPLSGDWTAEFDKQTRKLSAEVEGPFGKYRYDLIPVGAGDGSDDYTQPEPEPETLRVKARRIGDAEFPIVSACPGRQSYLSRGACWVCPDGYKRAKLTREMDHPEACEKRGWGKGPFRKAKRKNIAGARCPTGQFHIAEKGVNGCYQCPAGYQRDRSTRNSAMCLSRQG